MNKQQYAEIYQLAALQAHAFELEMRVHELEAKLASVEALADAAADAHIQAASDQHAHAEAMQEDYLRRLCDQSARIAELERELEVTRLRARSAEKLAGLNGE